MLVGLPGFGLGTLFYGVLLLGMGGAKLWCVVSEVGLRLKGIGKRTSPGSASPMHVAYSQEDELAGIP